jgi:asparagine synthase (glutamine-hydrolysing)
VLAALRDAVAHRRPRLGRLGADLSGGMDSTSLCFLAAVHTPDLLTVRWAEADDTNDDALFAAQAARALDRAEHLVLPQAELPDVFADPHAPADPEGPYAFARTAARTRYTAAALAEHGAGLHLAGHGGDELFYGAPNYLHPLVRRHPVTALRHLRGYRAMHRWPLTAALGGLARREDLPGWWRSQAAHLTDPPARRAPYLGWGPALRAPGWLTPQAADAARAVLRATADHAEPLAGDRGQHQTLAVLRAMGPTYRQRSRLYAAAGTELALPFYDDRVVEAVLAVRLPERTTPLRYKPLLAEAMRGTVPDAILARSTKGQFSADLLVGLRRHRPEILEVFADSALAARGLIAPDALRTALSAPQADLTTAFALEDLLGCETWLRAEPPRRPATPRKGMTDRAATP